MDFFRSVAEVWCRLTARLYLHSAQGRQRSPPSTKSLRGNNVFRQTTNEFVRQRPSPARSSRPPTSDLSRRCTGKRWRRRPMSTRSRPMSLVLTFLRNGYLRPGSDEHRFADGGQLNEDRVRNIASLDGADSGNGRVEEDGAEMCTTRAKGRGSVTAIGTIVGSKGIRSNFCQTTPKGKGAVAKACASKKKAAVPTRSQGHKGWQDNYKGGCPATPRGVGARARISVSTSGAHEYDALVLEQQQQQQQPSQNPPERDLGNSTAQHPWQSLVRVVMSVSRGGAV